MLTDNQPYLVVHNKKSEWGMGLVTDANEERMQVQFQDGKLRLFKKGWFHLLEAVEDNDANDDILEELKDRYGLSIAANAQAERAKEQGPLMTFKDQLRVFRRLYPGGFTDPDYVNSVRRDPDGRRLKRLREPAMLFAQKELAQEPFSALLAEENWTGVHDVVIKVLRKTSLASPSTVLDPLRGMPEESHERFAKALYDLLWGDGEFEDRFREWLKALEAGGPMKLTWPMTTVLPALVHPDKYVTVRTKVFRAQARTVAPKRSFRPNPAARSYIRYNGVAEDVLGRLKEAGHEPADLMDVYQFIWETLRPKGVEILADIKART